MRAVIAINAAYDRWCSYTIDSDDIVVHLDREAKLKTADDG